MNLKWFSALWVNIVLFQTQSHAHRKKKSIGRSLGKDEMSIKHHHDYFFHHFKIISPPIFHMTDPWELWVMWIIALRQTTWLSSAGSCGNQCRCLLCVFWFLASSLIIPLLGRWRTTWCKSFSLRRQGSFIDHWLLCLEGVQLLSASGAFACERCLADAVVSLAALTCELVALRLSVV